MFHNLGSQCNYLNFEVETGPLANRVFDMLQLQTLKDGPITLFYAFNTIQK